MDPKEQKELPKKNTTSNEGKKPVIEEETIHLKGITVNEFIDIHNKYWEAQNKKK